MSSQWPIARRSASSPEPGFSNSKAPTGPHVIPPSLGPANRIGNDRAALFPMDYPRRERLKVLGQARGADARAHPDPVAQKAGSADRSIVEWLFFHRRGLL
jgi:hypothetical protein